MMLPMENALFWQRLESLREERGKSQSEIAEFAFSHRNAYRNGMLAKSTPGIDFVDGAARCLDVSVDYLVTGFGEEEPYIPRSVRVPTDPERVLRDAESMARKLKLRPAAVALVLGQKPDPRLGVERILELFYRADRMLSGPERKASGASLRKRRPKKPIAASR